ncbi:MAG: rhomboid family intramembrane serine protease [Alphaproteobacteria bacterium]|nr:rhomboid family intramembrane serine protease [Alphaproteobacteria bacterium]
MYLSMDTPDPAAPRERLINAPGVVVCASLLLLGAHLAFTISPAAMQEMVIERFALIPEKLGRTGVWGGGYDGPIAAATPFLSSALLHADWLHVSVNAGFLLAFGSPVARKLGEDVRGGCAWALLFALSVVAGSLVFVLLNPGFPGVVVGASGGTSGLMAAALLAGRNSSESVMFAREFWGFTLLFAVSNLILTLIAPALLGGGLAWEAHLGGYVAGACLMLALDRPHTAGFS